MTREADWDITSDIGVTALGAAAARAIEGHRADWLMSDPYAELFVTAARPCPSMPTRPEQIDQSSPWWNMSNYVGVRARYFDQFFAAVPSTQAVLLAAGLDVRGYRLDWPAGAVVYELDVPKVLRFKQNVLADAGASPRAAIRHVAVDLCDDWSTALLAAGFDRSTPTTWLAEGLLPYLPDHAVRGLCTTVDGLSAPGSRFAVDHIDVDIRELADNMAADMDMTAADRWPTGKAFEPTQWLTDHGWQVASTPGAALATAHGRPLGPVVTGLRHSVLIAASKDSATAGRDNSSSAISH